MPTLLLIRHGLNDFVGKRLAGRLPDVHLNDKGRAQAAAIANSLAKLQIKAVYSSPLERAMETAFPLAESKKLEVVPHPGLLEVDFGEWQGKTFFQMHHMKLWPLVRQHPSQVRFPRGESFVEAQQRVVASLEDIRSKYQKRDIIACFSHSDSIRLALAHYLNMPLDSFQRISVDPASINGIYFGKEHIQVLNINSIPEMTKRE